MLASQHPITELVARAGTGDRNAISELLPHVYDELRTMAARYLSAEGANHTLQPTALVHEAYIRLAGSNQSLEGRAHFLAASATAMRRILVDHARKRGAAKRGSDATRVPLSPEMPAASRQDLRVLELNELIDKLDKLDERKARVVELRFFAGMTIKEIADALGLSTSAVDEHWAVARA